MSKEDINSIVNGAKFWTKLFVKVCGGFVSFKRLPDEKVLPVYKNILVLITKLIMMENFVVI